MMHHTLVLQPKYHLAKCLMAIFRDIPVLAVL